MSYFDDDNVTRHCEGLSPIILPQCESPGMYCPYIAECYAYNTSFCPEKFFCRTYEAKAVCPQGHFCGEGTSEPAACIFKDLVCTTTGLASIDPVRAFALLFFLPTTLFILYRIYAQRYVMRKEREYKTYGLLENSQFLSEEVDRQLLREEQQAAIIGMQRLSIDARKASQRSDLYNVFGDFGRTPVKNLSSPPMGDYGQFEDTDVAIDGCAADGKAAERCYGDGFADTSADSPEPQSPNAGEEHDPIIRR